MGVQSISDFLDIVLIPMQSRHRQHAGYRYRQTLRLKNDLWLTPSRAKRFLKLTITLICTRHVLELGVQRLGILGILKERIPI